MVRKIRHIRYIRKVRKKTSQKKIIKTGRKKMPGRIIEPDIEEAFREAEEALRPKREEQIDQSRGNTGKRNVRVVKKHTTTQQERET